MEWRMNTTTKAGQYQDTKIDVKLVLSALWIAMLIVFAYVELGGGQGDPDSDPGTQRQRLRRTGHRDRPRGVPGLDAHPRSAAPRSDAPDLCRALQPRAAPSRSRSCDTCGDRRGSDCCEPTRRSP